MTPASKSATEKALGRKILPGEPFVCIVEELLFTINEKEKVLNNCRTIIEHARKGREKRQVALEELERANERLANRVKNQFELLLEKDCCNVTQSKTIEKYRHDCDDMTEAIDKRDCTIYSLEMELETLNRYIKEDEDDEGTDGHDNSLKACNLRQFSMLEERDKKIKALKKEIQGRSIQNDRIIKLQDQVAREQECNKRQYRTITDRDELIDKLRKANLTQCKIIEGSDKIVKGLNERIDQAVNTLEFGS